MSCPICDNKPTNCDCSADAIRLHEENEKLRAEVFDLRTKETQAANRANVALLLLQNEAMRKIVDAAVAWESIPAIKVRADSRAVDALITAVDQYRMLTGKRNCDGCSGDGHFIDEVENLQVICGKCNGKGKL